MIDYYRAAASSEPMAFDTKVTVVNRALGKPVDRRIPVAIAQLDGKSLVEMDQVAAFTEPTRLPSGLTNGIAVVSFGVKSFSQIPGEPIAPPFVAEDQFYGGRRAALYRGAAGELIECIQMA